MAKSVSPFACAFKNVVYAKAGDKTVLIISTAQTGACNVRNQFPMNMPSVVHGTTTA